MLDYEPMKLKIREPWGPNLDQYTIEYEKEGQRLACDFGLSNSELPGPRNFRPLDAGVVLTRCNDDKNGLSRPNVYSTLMSIACIFFGHRWKIPACWPLSTESCFCKRCGNRREDIST